MQNKVFDRASPGFLYTIVAGILGIFAAFGVVFPITVTELGGQITTSLTTGGIYAVIGIIISSVIFPVWNRFKYGGPIMASTLTWIALANIALSVIALTGFTLPAGTVEQVIGAVQAKDYFALISIVATTIIPAIVRFIKSRKPPVVAPDVTTVTTGSREKWQGGDY